MKLLELSVPVRAVSEPNLSQREGWRARHGRAKRQRSAVWWALKPRAPLAPLLVVTLTRLGAVAIDDDNLRGALKHVRDEVAAWLKLDDASPLVRWRYAQREAPRRPMLRLSQAGKLITTRAYDYAVEITIEPARAVGEE
jgi:hypothetical protein